MLYIAACGNEASVRKYLKEMEGEYVREDVQILCGDEIEGSGTMPDVLFLSDSGIEECQKKIPVWFRRKAFDNAGELKQRKAGAERKRQTFRFHNPVSTGFVFFIHIIHISAVDCLCRMCSGKDTSHSSFPVL